VKKKGIAIIGMSCIFPGSPGVRAFWQNVVDKVDAISDPPDEYRASVYFDPDSSENDRIYCKRGGYLKDLATFSPMDYGVMPRSLDGGDPEHFLALRTANEALADSGYLDKPFDRSRTAIIMGKGTLGNRGYTSVLQHTIGVTQTLRMIEAAAPGLDKETLAAIRKELKKSIPPYSAESVPSVTANIVTGRIANRLDLMGPNYIVDAACASSIIALHNAVRELEDGRCDLALAGGVHGALTPPVLTAFSQIGAVSRSQRIRPFDSAADGTLFGEGVGVVVLKRLEDAERDGDRIYAVIRGIGVASDGRGAGLMAPRVEGEELALRRAYESAGVSPDTVELVEAHGTGTPVGDAAEIEALRRVFGGRSGDLPTCALGSVKSMVSHLVQAAGVAGLIKAALALHHRVLPPTIHCEDPKPELGLERTPFYVNTETRPWVHGSTTPRRAGVSSFGFGGIDTHVVLEEHDGEATDDGPQRWDTEVFVVRGQTREELVSAAERARERALAADAPPLHSLAAAVNAGLAPGGLRLAIVARSRDDLAKKLAYAAQRLRDPSCDRLEDRSGIYFFARPLAAQGSVAFLFPGESSQYVNMLSDLCVAFPEARAKFDRLDRLFIDNGRKVLPSQLLFPAPAAPSAPAGAAADTSSLEAKLWEIEYSVGSVFAANRALFDLLTRLEISPVAVAGHSCGEYAALLIASGVVDIGSEEELDGYTRELIRIHDSTLHLVPRAKLLTVALQDREAVSRIVDEARGELSVAMDNCPHQVILCGSDAAIETAQTRLQALGAFCTLLPFEHAYHTPQYKPVCEQYEPFFASLRIVPSPIALYSCTAADRCEQTSDVITKVAGEQWARPVRFRETIEKMHDDGIRIFVEVGPRGNLTSFVDDILKGREYLAVPSNVASRPALAQVNHLVGMLAAHGVSMKLDYLYSHRTGSHRAATKTGAKARPAIRLQTAMPELSIGDPALLAAIARAVAQAAGGAPPAAPAAAAVPAVPAATGQPAAPACGRSAVVAEYMATMEKFLESTSAITAGFAGQPNGRSSRNDGK
jgi:acyl transferase domain-containing protein